MSQICAYARDRVNNSNNYYYIGVSLINFHEISKHTAKNVKIKHPRKFLPIVIRYIIDSILSMVI